MILVSFKDPGWARSWADRRMSMRSFSFLAARRWWRPAQETGRHWAWGHSGCGSAKTGRRMWRSVIHRCTLSRSGRSSLGAHLLDGFLLAHVRQRMLELQPKEWVKLWLVLLKAMSTHNNVATAVENDLRHPYFIHHRPHWHCTLNEDWTHQPLLWLFIKL